jgi:uncharacterized protein (TIGR02117 family)
MKASAKKIVLKTGKWVVGCLLGIIVLIGIYALAAFLLSRMTAKPEPVSSSDVTIYILTNGVHTDLVVPIKTAQKDWSSHIRYEYTLAPDSLVKYVAFGWGDKGFYLDTPTWADLKFKTAFKAAFGLSQSAIHATFYHQLTEGKDCIKLSLSNEQYHRLVTYIENTFDTDTEGRYFHIITNANYGNNDAFYEAKGSYNLFRTCNTWANSGLKACGQKACIWTPLDKGIFYQYKVKDR